MKTLIYSVSALILTFLLSSWEKELDIKYHDIEPLTVIEGELTPDGVRVTLTQTTPMDEPMDRTHLTDADVVLSDLTTGEEYLITVGNDGVYPSAAGGIVGHDYRLDVTRGAASYSAMTHMYAGTEITELAFSWIAMPYDDVAVLRASLTDNPETSGDCYWLRIYRNGESYMTGIVKDTYAVNGLVSVMKMTSRKDIDSEDESTVLRDGDIVTLTVTPVSPSMYDYLEALENGTNGPYMFTGDRCLGYFIATTPVSSSITFRPDEIPDDK